MSSIPGLNLPFCLSPFLDMNDFNNSKGYIDGRLCLDVGQVTCCLPCPMTEWVYPDSFDTLGEAANWVAVGGTVCCVFLLLSWAVLPVEKTHRHYLSISLTIAVTLMNLGFVIPLAAKPEMCADDITPHGMQSSQVCAASGTFLILGGWAGVMWVFLRALSLHLQICWQVVVGRNFMWFSQATGWGIPIVAVILAIVFSGVSFRFGATCHINHQNSLADLWIPLLVFAGLTILIQFTTFGYCIKVYLASLSDNSASTEGSGLPSYTQSIRTMTPKQAYRRVRRVIQLQWRGIAIVLLIVADVIFFSIIFVFQDNTVQAVKNTPILAFDWISCLSAQSGDKNKCLHLASSIVVKEATVGALLVLLAVNGLWLVLLFGRWTMVLGWRDLFLEITGSRKREFVSADARMDDLKKDTRSYEMLSRDSGKPPMDDLVTPSLVSPLPLIAQSPLSPSGRRTPDYFGPNESFGPTARYLAPSRSFSSPRPPQSVTWDSPQTHARPTTKEEESGYDDSDMNPLGMNRI